MEHNKHLQYQIRITDNNSGEMEAYAIDWGVYTSVVDGNVLINFTHSNGNPGAFLVRTDRTIEVGFFEVKL